MDEIKTGFTEFIASASRVSGRQRKLIQRMVAFRARLKGLVTAEEADKLVEMDWQSFLEYVIERLPQIMEFIMQLIAIFGMF